MTRHLWPSITRILKPLDENRAVPIGIGFLVAERHIVTCSHVVANSLGIAPETVESPIEEVLLDFPLIASGNRLHTRIIFWDHEADIAVLELIPDPPDRAVPINIAIAENLAEHEFWAFGTPYGDEDGNWVQGVIMGPTGSNYFHLESRSGYRPELGFSGGPVWDEHLNAVVGMIVAVDEGRPEAGAGRMIHAAILAEILDNLGVQWPMIAKRPSTFRYAAFISYPSEPGQQGNCIREFVEEFYQTLSYELGGLLDYPIYFNREHVEGDQDLARALCESMCMILVLTPRYFNPSSPLYASEFKAMEDLERRRLQSIGAGKDFSLIIPILPYNRNILPTGVIGQRQEYGFENRTPGTLREHLVYGPRIRRIAEYIYACHQAFEACQEDLCGECIEFRLPELHEIQDLFGNIPTRRFPRFPTR